MTGAARWSADRLERTACGVSASRRTDIPALYGEWFAARLAAGYAEYVPAGPPRRVRASLAPERVTHFNFWSKWPQPFLPVLARVRERGFPVLWNVTVTGLGGSAIEPGVPPAGAVVKSIRALAEQLGPAAIQWRYDPIVLSARLDRTHHRETFARLAGELAGAVDRVTTSFIQPYGRRVVPKLRRLERETGDPLADPSEAERIELLHELAELGAKAGLLLTVCGYPELRAPALLGSADCNAWSWAVRIYPELARHRPLPTRPTRPGCTCSREIDIGAYDTCTLGCRYSYGTADVERACLSRRAHDPAGACLLSPPRRRA